MKRSQDYTSVFEQSPPQGDKRKRHETKLCTPFCGPEGCSNSGNHDRWIMSLVNMQESNQLNLSKWQASVDEAKESFDFNQPLVDPVFDSEYFSMLSWAAMLGKWRIVKWLLEQDFIVLFPNAEDTANGPVGSNLTALFSAVRHLHIGVTTRQTYEIRNCFAKILDEFLKRDSRMLLVEEGEANKITLLHLCAEGDEESTAPFVSYLKRILTKLSDLKQENRYTEKRLKRFLEQKNCRGDTFLHLVAKYKARQEANEVIKLTKEKLSGIIKNVTAMENDEGKTVDDVLEDFKQDPEVFQTDSQETEYRPLSGGASGACDEDEKGSDTTSPTDDPCRKELPLEENQGCSAMFMPVASTPSGERKKNLAECPPMLFPASEPDDMLHIQDSQSVNSNQANPVESMNSSTTPEIEEAKEQAKESVRKLIRRTTLRLDQEKGKHEELTRSLESCSSNIKELEGDLAKYEDILSKL
ncbi:uncharacterized protein [Montipora foliosa]|uniref:uncharacterized protein n=1 Tax=Montipora foliosa TaxID=591990 RepID=UPI0035F16049